MNELLEKIEINPIIAAIRRPEDFEEAINSQVSTIFLLHSDIFNLMDTVNTAKNKDKNIFIHIDFMEGLGKDQRALDYISEVIKPDGIISTRSNHIKYGMERGLFCIQRFFLVDSQSYEMTVKTIHNVQPHMVEIMPALMTGVVRKISQQVQVPVIAGGLIECKNDIIEALKAGAVGVSTGKRELWRL